MEYLIQLAQSNNNVHMYICYLLHSQSLQKQSTFSDIYSDHITFMSEPISKYFNLSTHT
jgi:hypothetical protein